MAFTKPEPRTHHFRSLITALNPARVKAVCAVKDERSIVNDWALAVEGAGGPAIASAACRRNGGATDIAIVGGQNDRSRCRRWLGAGAADGTADGQRAGSVENEGPVVNDVCPCRRAAGTPSPICSVQPRWWSRPSTCWFRSESTCRHRSSSGPSHRRCLASAAARVFSARLRAHEGERARTDAAVAKRAAVIQLQCTGNLTGQ